MNNLNDEINNIKLLLTGILGNLNAVNDENFDENLTKAKLGMEEVNRLKFKLKEKYPLQTLNKYDAVLLEITKQIQVSFDNIFTKKKNQLAEIGKQIAILKNKSKLVNYYR
ncbi:MAG: hypothetical protein ACYCVH_10815 [Ignavibacteriaceae bacterium]